MKLSPIDRFMRLVLVVETGCWIWLGSTGGNNEYGRFSVNGDRVMAHRWSYEHHTGKKLPQSKDGHHVCETPRCVNWRHIKPATPQQNYSVYRRVRICPRHQSRKVRVCRKWRCRACHAEAMRRWRANQKARRMQSTLGVAA